MGSSCSKGKHEDLREAAVSTPSSSRSKSRKSGATQTVPKKSALKRPTTEKDASISSQRVEPVSTTRNVQRRASPPAPAPASNYDEPVNQENVDPFFARRRQLHRAKIEAARRKLHNETTDDASSSTGGAVATQWTGEVTTLSSTASNKSETTNTDHTNNMLCKEKIQAARERRQQEENIMKDAPKPGRGLWGDATSASTTSNSRPTMGNRQSTETWNNSSQERIKASEKHSEKHTTTSPIQPETPRKEEFEHDSQDSYGAPQTVLSMEPAKSHAFVAESDNIMNGNKEQPPIQTTSQQREEKVKPTINKLHQSAEEVSDTSNDDVEGPVDKFGGEEEESPDVVITSLKAIDSTIVDASRSHIPKDAHSVETNSTIATKITLSKLEVPGGSVYYNEISNSQFKRVCTRMFKKLNHDPWDEFKRYRDDDVADYAQEFSATCRVQYKFDHFSGDIFPLSMLCTLGPSVGTLAAVFLAYEDAKNECDPWIGTPLHYACSYRAKAPIIQFLVQQDPSMLGKVNQFGRTPLHMACLFKASAKTGSHLVQTFPKAAEVHDKDGYTPLHLACENGSHIDVLELLVSVNKQSCVAVNQNDSTPLHLACTSNPSKSIIELLVNVSPQAAEMVNMHGEIPLHLAVTYGAPVEAIRMLVNAYPDGVMAENERGQTPLRIAKRNKSPDTVLKLLTAPDSW